MSGAKKPANKNAYRRAKKKEQQSEAPSQANNSARETESPAPDSNTSNDTQAVKPVTFFAVDENEYEQDLDNPLFEQYRNIFEKFREPTEEEAAAAKDDEKPEVFYDGDDIPDEVDDEQPRISKKQRKQMKTLSVAELKSQVARPELVEWTDVSSTDPVLLIDIKGGKNVIPVPTHWSLKREYLSSKRGIEKPAFALPKFIQETGIAEMRDAVLEKQAEMTMRQKQRERVQGKLGKLDIDYAKLYDAFFRRQTKPELTRYGEVYYEGKEFETNLVNLKPGELSEELREALSMAPGHPPPWLITMQRFGPPPSYPNMRIPGVNAPIPAGASWGFTPGQWGKPPTDDAGKSLFGGDLYGTAALEEQQQPSHPGEAVERRIWGALRAEGESEDEESDEEEDEDEDEEEGDEEDGTGIQTSMTTASAMPSEVGGMESIGGEFTLRKQRKGIETEEPGIPRSAGQVLPEKNISATGFFGGEHAYDLDAARRDTFGQQRKRKAGEVEVSVDVDQLGEDDKLDKDALKREYESRQRADAAGQWQSIDQDDLADMIASESRKRTKRVDDSKTKR
ncbi:hypothetical protein GQ44DRAFT_744113 [Phaeosphaeriaceae sp. PMI808]|nr:hypothetical protein GQ44DRAFT_744113 [Phaeosphaeriaceae sp. PMI808]